MGEKSELREMIAIERIVEKSRSILESWLLISVTYPPQLPDLPIERKLTEIPDLPLGRRWSRERERERTTESKAAARDTN